MKIIFALTILFSFFAEAKTPSQPEAYLCSPGEKPVLLHETSTGVVLGICGAVDPKHQYSQFEVFQFANKVRPQMPLFKSNSDNKYLVLGSENNLILIEQVKIKNRIFEIFKNKISCNSTECEIKKEICIQSKSVKMIEDKEVKARLKKAGCLK